MSDDHKSSDQVLETVTISASNAGAATRPAYSDIVAWCRTYIGGVLNLPPEKIDPSAEFESLGLDSAVAVALVAEMGAWLNRDLEPAVLFEYSTIAALAEHLSQP
jgi:acyl carrier protein